MLKTHIFTPATIGSEDDLRGKLPSSPATSNPTTPECSLGVESSRLYQFSS